MMNKKQISRLSLGALLALAFVGCVGEAQQKQQMPVGEYDMLTLELGDSELMKVASATIRGCQDIDIYPQIGGTLTAINVKEGDRVKAGDVMFVIDQVPYKAALAAAEASVATAEASLQTAKLTYEGREQLFESGVVSEYELLTSRNSMSVAEANVATAEASLINAQNNLSYTTVTAPAAGVIGTLPYRVGALVSAATALTTLSDNSTMEVYFSVAESDLLSMIRMSGSREAAIKSFPAVSLRLSDGSTYEHEGRVKSMSGVIDRSTGTVSVRADFANPEGLLHSGATGNIIIPTYRKGVILIPQTVTFELQDKRFVYTIVEGRAKSKMITTTAVPGGREFIIESGIEAGEQIVAEGVGLLREGTPIKAKGAAVAPDAE